MSALTDMGEIYNGIKLLADGCRVQEPQDQQHETEGLSHTGKHFLSSFPVCKILARLFAKL